MLTKNAKKSLIKWKPINERMMYARCYTSTLKISLIVVYAPTNESTEEAKEAFIEQLQETISGIPKHDILLVIGDFNANVGNKGREGAMGKHGIGERNESKY